MLPPASRTSHTSHFIALPSDLRCEQVCWLGERGRDGHRSHDGQHWHRGHLASCILHLPSRGAPTHMVDGGWLTEGGVSPELLAAGKSSLAPTVCQVDRRTRRALCRCEAVYTSRTIKRQKHYCSLRNAGQAVLSSAIALQLVEHVY